MKLPNRVTAGQDLAKTLKFNKWDNAIILALPRGGVPVGAQIAKELEIPLDVILVKKITSPRHPEFAIGAIAEFDKPLWNSENISLLKIKESELATLAAQTQKRIFEQQQKWRKKDETIVVNGKTVILVDDGLATGLTMHAAVNYVKQHGAKEVIVAVPVAPQSAKESFTYKVDEFVSLQTPDPFYSVGQFYTDFTQVSDDEVTLLLNEERKARRGFAGSFFSTAIP